jgi:hypothetical protein
MPTVKSSFLFLLCLVMYTPLVSAQHEALASSEHQHTEGFKPHFRAAVLLGHTLITPENAQTRLFVPSWGFDFEYWPTHVLGIGLHSDVELQDFIVANEEEEEVERKEPFIITLDALYRPWKGLVLMGGPGLEIEREETFFLFRVGLEYEVGISENWDLFPTFFYDQRLDGYSTLSIGLGVGTHF